ncbi:MAG: alpha-2-macroglobulin family protein, partial [Pirellula sp.]
MSEAIPLPIRGKSTKEFELKKLVESAASPTIRHQSLTVQMTSQPAWYAVLALPYLMEYPYECSEQTFNRLYANSLARHIAKSDPKIAKVFETWRNLQPQALESPLSKNKDIQSILLEETPWLKDAQKESQARRNVGLLFDTNRLESETQSQLNKLAQMQRPSGLWPWFPGGPDNEYLSLYIVTGFGRLKNLGVAIDDGIAQRALGALDAWMNKQYIEIKDKDPKKSNLSSTIALYLYGRSFFLSNQPIAPDYQAALKYWLGQGRDHWVGQARQTQAHLAVALKRFEDAETPKAILKSFKERSVTDEEIGMYWPDAERSWWWYHAPIETQAMMIEAFDEVAGDTQAVEECKVWLLKQKQTQDWKTT